MIHDQGDNPKAHIAHLREAMEHLIDELHIEKARIDEPSARALLESTGELLDGLIAAYQQYETSDRRPTFRLVSR